MHLNEVLNNNNSKLKNTFETNEPYIYLINVTIFLRERECIL